MAQPNELPTMDSFVQHQLQPYFIFSGHGECGLCGVCQEGFNDSPHGIVRISTCTHLFHRNCLLKWFNSTHSKRNTCPACRKLLFQLSNLTPEDIEAFAEEAARHLDAVGQIEEEEMRKIEEE
ncbi:hypothetical protein BU26DRAFT_559741 [Trematosphaeria pertusa]|uniref:RING-type domain-containing protein n=1 Tax=Trematosphaeria pertusa TaxID=390896 RepID=A0A6A6IZV9_9PLEO|nr:uncharacterized protein BU26DRAFT_559741 [Trematosphaeria pertusa]KAF2255120.1 hypothetical protein BU26DRAFT_559741 [Trematosphaeria pertusa]